MHRRPRYTIYTSKYKVLIRMDTNFNLWEVFIYLFEFVSHFVQYIVENVCCLCRTLSTYKLRDLLSRGARQQDMCVIEKKHKTILITAWVNGMKLFCNWRLAETFWFASKLSFCFSVGLLFSFLRWERFSTERVTWDLESPLLLFGLF